MEMYSHPEFEGGPFFWKGDGRDGILLIHGFTGTCYEMRTLASLLNKQGYTTAGPLLPGHGTSPQDANHFGRTDWLAAAERTYQELKATCQRVVIAGQSMGALLALSLAAAHPEAGAIICFAPALRVKNLSLTPWLAPFVAVMSKRHAPPLPGHDFPWQGYPVAPVRAAAELYHLQQDVRKLLPRVSQPLLILQGRLDTSVELDGAKEIYDICSSPIKEFHWLENSTHCMCLDVEVDLIVDYVKNFLAKNLLTG